MVGEEGDVFYRCLPIMELLGPTITHEGANSAGQVVKSCNQILGAVTIAALSEALVLGAKAGVDPQKIVQVLSKGAARCWPVEVRVPDILKRDFRVGFKSSLQDLDLALELSESLNTPTQVAALVRELYKSVVALGCGGEDYSSVIRVIERLSDFELGQAV